eukprot:GFUD01036165.1.p2 GENE.GFUD01036165.1~~GFUD01036165.1.p2  ORF type:complete len:139 (-),score=47.74 GFUD01036165.1:68-484(-)
MHTFLIRVGLVGQNSTDTVDKVKQLLKESLKTDFDNSNIVLKERMDHNLGDIFGSESNFLLFIDSMWRWSTPDKKSFFVNIMVKKKKNIIIMTAEYKEIKTLKDLAAMVVARFFKDKKDVDKLEDVPKSLFDDIKEFL